MYWIDKKSTTIYKGQRIIFGSEVPNELLDLEYGSKKTFKDGKAVKSKQFKTVREKLLFLKKISEINPNAIKVKSEPESSKNENKPEQEVKSEPESSENEKEPKRKRNLNV